LSASMPIADYVALPLLETTPHRRARQLALEALERMGSLCWADARWSTMSDSERTLVAIARAIVGEPALLFADDPTGGLDTREREVVLGLLRRLTESCGTTVLITVPALPDTLRAHRIMSLSDGELMQASDNRAGLRLTDAAAHRCDESA
jgi:ABC-type ATPase involved in cell division